MSRKCRCYYGLAYSQKRQDDKEISMTELTRMARRIRNGILMCKPNEFTVEERTEREKASEEAQKTFANQELERKYREEGKPITEHNCERLESTISKAWLWFIRGEIMNARDGKYVPFDDIDSIEKVLKANRIDTTLFKSRIVIARRTHSQTQKSIESKEQERARRRNNKSKSKSSCKSKPTDLGSSNNDNKTTVATSTENTNNDRHITSTRTKTPLTITGPATTPMETNLTRSPHRTIDNSTNTQDSLAKQITDTSGMNENPSRIATKMISPHKELIMPANSARSPLKPATETINLIENPIITSASSTIPTNKNQNLHKSPIIRPISPPRQPVIIPTSPISNKLIIDTSSASDSSKTLSYSLTTNPDSSTTETSNIEPNSTKNPIVIPVSPLTSPSKTLNTLMSTEKNTLNQQNIHSPHDTLNSDDTHYTRNVQDIDNSQIPTVKKYNTDINQELQITENIDSQQTTCTTHVGTVTEPDPPGSTKNDIHTLDLTSPQGHENTDTEREPMSLIDIDTVRTETNLSPISSNQYSISPPHRVKDWEQSPAEISIIKESTDVVKKNRSNSIIPISPLPELERIRRNLFGSDDSNDSQSEWQITPSRGISPRSSSPKLTERRKTYESDQLSNKQGKSLTKNNGKDNVSMTTTNTPSTSTIDYVPSSRKKRERQALMAAKRLETTNLETGNSTMTLAAQLSPRRGASKRHRDTESKANMSPEQKKQRRNLKKYIPEGAIVDKITAWRNRNGVVTFNTYINDLNSGIWIRAEEMIELNPVAFRRFLLSANAFRSANGNYDRRSLNHLLKAAPEVGRVLKPYNTEENMDREGILKQFEEDEKNLITAEKHEPTKEQSGTDTEIDTEIATSSTDIEIDTEDDD